MFPATALVGRLFDHARDRPDTCALLSAGESVSYAELAERVQTQARLLAGDGVASSSVVGIACDDELAHLVLCLAVAQLGATSCTVPTYESADQQRRFQEKARVTLVVRKQGAVERLSPDAPDAEPLLSATPGAKLLFSTSGTTGEPKLVCHCDAGLVAQAHRHVNAPERFACLASVEHNFVKRHRLYCLAAGATNVFLRASMETLVEQFHALEPTTLHMSAYQARELLGVPQVESLRALRLKLGGSHVPASLRAMLREHVTENLQCGYGTTETGAIAFTDPGDADSAESVGRALPGIEIRVMEPLGAPAATGEGSEAGDWGEVAIRCEGMFVGYLGKPEWTAARLRDGWFHTGDFGRLDEQQRLHLGGRSDDMFVFNSMNIIPQDIESQVLAHPRVVDAAVLAQPSEVHGDVPVALVVFDRAGAPDLGELKSFVRARTGLRCPRRFVVVERIPRNSAGKVLRDEARALLRA